MRKIFFPAGGRVEVGQVPDPAPQPGRLLVHTEAIGVGVGLVRMLTAAGERGEPARPGAEMVGTVVAAGFTIGPLNRTQPTLIEQRRAELWKLLTAGRLRPRHVNFPFEQLPEALELVATRRNCGRVALRTQAGESS
jgi:NADPH:quinone reductase-like Zn-dependent oxidoreductase